MGKRRFGLSNSIMIGFTCGAFDLLHAGHIVMLKEAKDNCDYLIVGLQTDPSIDRQEKNQPVQSVYERYIQLRAVKYIDEIKPFLIYLIVFSTIGGSCGIRGGKV